MGRGKFGVVIIHRHAGPMILTGLHAMQNSNTNTTQIPGYLAGPGPYRDRVGVDIWVWRLENVVLVSLYLPYMT